MSIYCTYPETRDLPAEYASDNEIECVICEQDFDGDDENFPGEDEICQNHTQYEVDEYYEGLEG